MHETTNNSDTKGVSAQSISLKNINVSYGKGYTDLHPVTVTLEYALERIRTGASKDLVLKIRELNKGLPDTEAEKTKAKLQSKYIIFQGTFPKRSKAGLDKASGLAILDFDHVEDPEKEKKIIFIQEFILAAWISPSGDGVKALARIPIVKDDAEYKLYYNALLKELKKFSVSPDRANKDISRMCFESYDPDILLKEWEKTSVFNKRVNESLIKTPEDNAVLVASEDDLQETFTKIVARIKKSGGKYLEGRHEFLMRVVKDCIKYGVDKETTFAQVMKNYSGHEGDLSDADIEKTVNNLWKTHYSKEVFGSKRLEDESSTQKNNPVQRAIRYLDSKMESGDILFNKMTQEIVFRDGMDKERLYIDMRASGQSIKISELSILLEKNYAIPYDPISQYFDNIMKKYPFEEVNGSIKELCKYVDAKHNDLFDSMFRKHLIRCIGQGRGEFINRFIFVLQQERQNTGKSEFIRYLNPFGKELYTETIDEHNQILTLSQSFMINMEELHAFKQRDVNSLKALISKGHDQVRVLYTQVNKTFVRRASFWGSTNNVEFLDDSSNTRWLIMKIEEINFDYNNWNTGERVNIEKVWAEAAYLWEQRESTQPTTDEWKLLEAINKEFINMNDHDHWLSEFLSPADEGYLYLATPTEIATYLKTKGASASPQKIGIALRKAGFKKGRQQKGGNRVNGFYVKTKSGASIKTGEDILGMEDDQTEMAPDTF